MLVVGTTTVIEIELSLATVCEVTFGAFSYGTGVPTGAAG